MSTKVFVGNLAFKTKPETLKEEFEAAGAVVTANIITRGPRSLGYGFVEFSTAEAAENAVKLLNQKEVDGRTINVEVAKPREETPAGEGSASEGAEGEKGAPARGPRAPRPRRQFNNTNNGNNANTNAGGSPSGNGGAPRRAYRPRTYSDNNNTKQEGESGSGSPQQGQRPPRRNYNQGGQPQQQQQGGFQQGGRRPFRPRNNSNSGQPQQQQGGNPRPPRQFQQKPQVPRPQTERKPSETTLFVANLPFAVDDAELKEIFSGFKVATAHVVTKRNGRSKGFGFVTFETHEDQQAALAAKDNQTYKERLLNVKVALVNQTGQVVADGEGEKEADAPAADVPATEEKAAPATEEAKPAESKPEESA